MKTYLEEHAEMAAETFAGFEILSHEKAGDMDRWTIGKPGGFANRQFTVVRWPGNILTTGDNGECWWQRERDMISWCRHSIGCISYFAEKVVDGFQTREFDADEVEQWVRNRDIGDVYPDGATEDQRAEFDYTKGRLLAALRDGEYAFTADFTESEWHEPGEWPGRQWECYTQQFLWARAAIAKFLDLLDAQDSLIEIEDEEAMTPLDLMETDRNRWRMVAVAGWALFLILVALTGFLR